MCEQAAAETIRYLHETESDNLWIFFWKRLPERLREYGWQAYKYADKRQGILPNRYPHPKLHSAKVVSRSQVIKFVKNRFPQIWVIECLRSNTYHSMASSMRFDFSKLHPVYHQMISNAIWFMHPWMMNHHTRLYHTHGAPLNSSSWSVLMERTFLWRRI